MEELIGGLSQSFAHAGPEWGFLALVTVLAFARLVPMAERHMELAEQREDRREARKAEESRLREEHDREYARLQGQWLEQQDRSNSAMEASNVVAEGLRVQLSRLADSLDDSKGHSREMGQKMETVASQVKDLHDHIVKGGRQ